MNRHILDRVLQFNWGRDPERLLLKYCKMQDNSFSFFRATCHLFYQDWASAAIELEAPLTWSCGDLHLENFGSYKGDDRQVYFGINDFDEAILAPCSWELVRFLTSLFVAAPTLKINPSETKQLAICYLKAYTKALQTGKVKTSQLATAEGMVKTLLRELKQRRRNVFLDRYTYLSKNQRQIIPNTDKVVTISTHRRLQLETCLAEWATTQPNPAFFRVLDVVGRLAGTASLGLMRYLVLVEGKGSPDRNYLLDLKQIHPSCLHPYVSVPQPNWQSDAERVQSVQTWLQLAPPALLHGLILQGQSFVLRELQPTQDKLNLTAWQGKFDRLEKVIKAMGKITAWSQIQSGGREGAASIEHLFDFAQNPDWHTSLIDYAEAYTTQVEADHTEFCRTFAAHQKNPASSLTSSSG